MNWLSVTFEVKQYIEHCVCCIMSKKATVQLLLGHLHASRSLQILAIDFTMLEMANDGQELFW